MEKIQLDIQINAPAKTVWDALWKDENYRKWTSAFCAGSYAKSDWEEGSPIQFLDPKGDGMFSIIETKIPNQQMTFKHLGEMKQYEEKPKDWAGLKEAYLGADRHSWTQAELDDYERASIKEQDEIGRVELAEKKRTFDIAKAMKNKGISIIDIAEMTGLSKEEIERL